VQEKREPAAVVKRQYSKPMVEKVNLNGEEAALASCKTSGGTNSNKNNNQCSFWGNCRNPAS
jgi:hypothetical protein